MTTRLKVSMRKLRGATQLILLSVVFNRYIFFIFFFTKELGMFLLRREPEKKSLEAEFCHF